MGEPAARRLLLVGRHRPADLARERVIAGRDLLGDLHPRAGFQLVAEFNVHPRDCKERGVNHQGTKATKMQTAAFEPIAERAEIVAAEIVCQYEDDVGALRRIGQEHLPDTFDLGGRLRRSRALMSGDQHRDLAAHLRGRRHGVAASAGWRCRTPALRA